MAKLHVDMMARDVYRDLYMTPNYSLKDIGRIAEAASEAERFGYLRGLRVAEQLLRKRAADWRTGHFGQLRDAATIATDADAAADAIAALIAEAEADKENDNG